MSCKVYLACRPVVEADASLVWLLFSAMRNFVNFTEIRCVISSMDIQDL